MATNCDRYCEYSKSMCSEFWEMRRAGELMDVTLVFDDKRIPCHRLVLAAKCDYFRTMFTSCFREKTSQEIVIHGVDAMAGTALVDYFYEGDLKITKENAESLLAATSMLLLEDLNMYVARYMADHIIKQEKKCPLKVMEIAHLHSQSTLLPFAARRMFIEELHSFESKEIGMLREEDLRDLVADVDGDLWADVCDYGKRNKEEEKFHLLKAWVNVNKEKENVFMELISTGKQSRTQQNSPSTEAGLKGRNKIP